MMYSTALSNLAQALENVDEAARENDFGPGHCFLHLGKRVPTTHLLADTLSVLAEVSKTERERNG